MKIDLSIIIVTYNVKDLLKHCLESLKNSAEYAGLAFETFVVDNGNDGTGEMIRKDYNEVEYISNSANDGYSKSNNIALRKSKGKYILVLNPDAKLQEDTLKIMYDFMESHLDVGIATPKVELPDGKLDGACHRGFPTPWNAFCRFTHLSRRYPASKLFNGYNLGYLDINTTHEIDCLSGAFMFVRKRAIDGDGSHAEVGLFDEDFWANGEDIDWCYRFKCAGWKICYVPDTRIIHYKGASSGTQISSQDVTNADVETKRKWINAFYDAMPIFYRKHYQKKYCFFVKWIVFLGVEVKRRIAMKKLLST